MKKALNAHITINFTTIDKRSNIPNIIDILVVDGKPKRRISYSCMGIECHTCPFNYGRRCSASSAITERTSKSTEHFNKLIQPLLKTLRSKPC